MDLDDMRDQFVSALEKQRAADMPQIEADFEALLERARDLQGRLKSTAFADPNLPLPPLLARAGAALDCFLSDANGGVIDPTRVYMPEPIMSADAFRGEKA